MLSLSLPHTLTYTYIDTVSSCQLRTTKEMISIFQFCTFHIHCMYIYINIPAASVYSVYISVDIPDIVVLSHDFC